MANRDDRVSKRAAAGIRPLVPYLPRFLHALGNQYDPTHNPDGEFIMTTAENKLCLDMLREKINDISAKETLFDEEVAFYNAFNGLPPVRQAFAAYFEKFMLHRPVDPEHLVVAAGVASALEHLYFALGDSGDGVMVITPCYPAFEAELGLRAQMELVPVQTLPPDFAITEAALHNAFATAKVSIRAVLITNPTNPLANFLSIQELQIVTQFCDKTKIHLISDEIYAGALRSAPSSAAGNEIGQGGSPSTTFHSIGSKAISPSGLGPMRHIVYGLSKDFCLSGFRVGCIISENESVLKYLGSTSVFSGVSHHTQRLIEHMLTDLPWVEKFLRVGTERTREAYSSLASALQDTKARIIGQPVSGQFCFIDVRAYLPDVTWAAERRFCDELMDATKSVVVSGEACQCSIPGFIRIVYTWLPLAHLAEVCGRIASFLKARPTKTVEAVTVPLPIAVVVEGKVAPAIATTKKRSRECRMVYRSRNSWSEGMYAANRINPGHRFTEGNKERSRCIVCCMKCHPAREPAKYEESDITPHDRLGHQSRFGCYDCQSMALGKATRDEGESDVVPLCNRARFPNDRRSCFEIFHSQRGPFPELKCLMGAKKAKKATDAKKDKAKGQQ